MTTVIVYRFLNIRELYLYKQQTFLRSQTPKGSHLRQCEYTAHLYVREVRTPLLKFKIEREILVLESSRLSKNYFVIFDIVVKSLAYNQGKFFCYSFGIFRDVNIR